MPKKQVKSVKEAAAAVVPPAKPRSPRIRTAQHSKTAATAEIVGEALPEAPSAKNELNHQEIAVVAYSYWESRGYQGGNPADDWFRAEAELRRTSVS